MNKIAVEGNFARKKVRLSMGQTTAKRTLKEWIAVLVQVNCEKKTAAKLNKAGYETYIPTQQEVRQWSDRKKKVNRLILPTVVFVRATEREEKWLRDQSYIHKLLALPGSDEDRAKLATPIPDNQIERLKFLLENASDRVMVGFENFIAGDKVRVTCGPMKGIMGFVQIMNGTNFLLIEVGFLGCARVSIEKSMVQKIYKK